MLTLGSLAFAAPWALLALGTLPILWWLLRITPPRPKQIQFPPLRLLAQLIRREETPAHTPLWLLLLRLFIAALVILGLAEPLLNPDRARIATGPLVLVIDDGWSAAPRWRVRIARAEALLERAEREGRGAMLITTAPPANAEPIAPGALMPAADLRPLLAALQPKPWASDRAALVQALQGAKLPDDAEVAWIADGLADDATGEAAYTLAERLLRQGGVNAILPEPDDAALALLPPETSAQGDTLRLKRPAGANAARSFTLRAVNDRGRVLSREPIAFAAGADTAEIKLGLPTELRNQLARLEIEEQPAAGAVQLLDDRWRRRPVGIISGAGLESRQPLLADLFYLERALNPFAELRQGSVAQLLEREIAVIAMADVAQVVGGDNRRLAEWIEKGGMLLRFAGPRMAEAADDLLPVKLRRGSRQLGSALSWSQPLKLGDIPESSPLHGLPVSGEVTVSRQVLAEPEPQLGDKTWLRLEDGTPLITAERRGRGWLILVHTTANTLWSDLSLSGFFVEMLRKVVELSQGVGNTAEAEQPLAPLSMLDGFGRAAEPGPAVQSIPPRQAGETRASPRHPPGFYGQWDSRQAVNLARADTVPLLIPRWPADVRLLPLDAESRETRLMPWLLAAAMLVFLADWIIGLWLRGMSPRLPRRAAAALALVLLLGVSATAAMAQPGRRSAPVDDFTLRAALDLRLAYVITGDAAVDNLSRAGLSGLTDILFRRTSIEASDPIGVNIEADDISLLPFLYWPMVPSQPVLSEAALKRLDTFLKTGGMILFDTRDTGYPFAGTGASPGTEKLRQLLGKLDIPPLMPVPDDHVLTKAFYLLQEFPGRYTGGPVWVERNPGGDKDGVTSIVIGGHDWAAAWATDPSGRPMAPTQPNTPRQRELAYRFGVNLLMYTLTGNYKADQVHIPALLERLGN